VRWLMAGVGGLASKLAGSLSLGPRCWLVQLHRQSVTRRGVS
jgi:hypothetical protein